MKYNPISRRHFLQGLAGASLALPFMPSLMPKADAAVFTGPKYFFLLASMHGCLADSSLYPSVAATKTQQLYTGSAASGLDHVARYDTLANLRTARTDSFNPTGALEVSPVLGNFLNPYIGKINVLRGLDLMFGGGHHTGGYLGNFHGNDNASNGFDSRLTLPPMPTIDQVMAGSANFYAPSDPITSKIMIANAYTRVPSWYNDAGTIKQAAAPGYNDASSLFNSIWGTNYGNTSNTSNLVSIVDKVYDDYNRLNSSVYGPGKRLSQADRLTLQAHMDELRSLETRIQNQAAACTVTPPGSVSFAYDDRVLTNIQVDWATYIDVMTNAIKCGMSRIGIMAAYHNSAFSGDFHQQIAHLHYNADAQQELIRSHRFTGQNVFARLLSKLDVEITPGGGTTYLDNSLVVWNMESSYWAHDGWSLPTITAGSAGGYFNTGLYVDYRNLSNLGITRWHSELRPGLPMNRWLYTVLTAMGIQPSEYARSGMIGYGDPWQATDMASYAGHTSWPTRVTNDMGKPLPIIVA